MQLTLIGELAKKISDETRSTSAIHWKEMAGFRDRAIHDYYRIDVQVVWDTIVGDLKPLEAALNKIIETSH